MVKVRVWCSFFPSSKDYNCPSNHATTLPHMGEHMCPVCFMLMSPSRLDIVPTQLLSLLL